MTTTSKNRAVVIVAYLSLFFGLGILTPALILLTSRKDAPSRDHVKWALILHLTLMVLASLIYIALVPARNEIAVGAIVLAAIVALNVGAMMKSLRQMKLASAPAAI